MHSMAKEKKTYHWFPIIDNHSVCPICNTEFVTSKLVLTLYDGLNANSINATHKIKFCNSCHVPFLTAKDVKTIEQEHPGYHLETSPITNQVSRIFLEKRIAQPPLPIKNIPKNTLLFIGEEHHHSCGTEHMTRYQGIIHGEKSIAVKIAECSICKRHIISAMEYAKIKKKYTDYIYVTDRIAWKDIFPTQKVIYLLNINQYTKERCPNCGKPLRKNTQYFKNDKTATLQPKRIKECTGCQKTFARQTSFDQYYETYKFSNQFYQDEPFRKNGKQVVIKTGDFLTRHNLQNCMTNHHSMEDITAQIRMVDKSGTEFDYDVPAIRCDTCGKLFLLETEYQKIQTKGIPLCAIVENEYWKSKNDKNKPWAETDAKGSVMYVHGYNVSMVNNLSPMQRHAILKTLIQDEILTKGQILSHLDMLIKRAENIPILQKAKEKWIMDRNYITQYDNNTETILANSITHKTYHNQ